MKQCSGYALGMYQMLRRDLEFFLIFSMMSILVCDWHFHYFFPVCELSADLVTAGNIGYKTHCFLVVYFLKGKVLIRTQIKSYIDLNDYFINTEWIVVKSRQRKKAENFHF